MDWTAYLSQGSPDELLSSVEYCQWGTCRSETHAAQAQGAGLKVGVGRAQSAMTVSYDL
jgi:hypothetical protein